MILAPARMRVNSTLTDREHSHVAWPAGIGKGLLAPARNQKSGISGTERVIRIDAPGSIDARSAPLVSQYWTH
ncbi:MAG: hypothetical protein LZF62_190013 [Nitrospira sp.]|nr:MAG: hypothetical protein LZF62_190013 [Nitrospira sp.]